MRPRRPRSRRRPPLKVVTAFADADAVQAVARGDVQVIRSATAAEVDVGRELRRRNVSSFRRDPVRHRIGVDAGPTGISDRHPQVAFDVAYQAVGTVLRSVVDQHPTVGGGAVRREVVAQQRHLAIGIRFVTVAADGDVAFVRADRDAVRPRGIGDDPGHPAVGIDAVHPGFPKRPRLARVVAWVRHVDPAVRIHRDVVERVEGAARLGTENHLDAARDQVGAHQTVAFRGQETTGQIHAIAVRAIARRAKHGDRLGIGVIFEDPARPAFAIRVGGRDVAEQDATIARHDDAFGEVQILIGAIDEQFQLGIPRRKSGSPLGRCTGPTTPAM
jgi:hypothetical protein